MKKNIYGLQIGVEEMKRHLQMQRDGVDALKNSAMIVLSSSSIIFGLFNFTQLSNAFPIKGSVCLIYFKIILLLLVFGVFISQIILCFLTLKPMKMLGPINPNFDEVNNAFLNNKSKTEILQQELSNYLNVISDNKSNIEKKSKIVNWAWYLFVANIALILFEIVISYR